MSPPASCFRGAHRLLPGCNQLHAVHPALRRHHCKSFRIVIFYTSTWICYIYICTCSYLSLSLLCYISSKRDNKHDESTDLSNIQIRNMVLKINRHVLLSQGFNRLPNKFWCCRNLKAMLLGPRRAARFSSHGFGNGWKWCVCTAQNSSRPTF